jgi:hypothetical protein
VVLAVAATALSASAPARAPVHLQPDPVAPTTLFSARRCFFFDAPAFSRAPGCYFFVASARTLDASCLLFNAWTRSFDAWV